MPRRSYADPSALAALDDLVSRQSGVVTAPQALDLGLSEAFIRAAVTAARWRRLHRGVFLTSGAPPDLGARMWAAHLAAGPDSVIAGEAAGRVWGLLDADPPLHSPLLVLVPEAEHRLVPGLATRRVLDPSAWAHRVRTPPMLTVEHTVLDLARLARTDRDAVSVVLRACRMRLTSPDRIGSAMAGRARVRRRPLLKQVCSEVREGVTSPLERRYLHSVVRSHGLPAGRAQARAIVAGGRVYRDVELEEFRVVIELDGRLGHETESDVFRDQGRDNAAAIEGWTTLRYGWLAVTVDPCLVAAQIASLLTARGWARSPRSCRPGCAVSRRQRAA